MELSQLDLTIAWVSTLATTVGATLAAFKFLLREMRRGFDRNDDKFDRIDDKFDRINEKFDRQDDKFTDLQVAMGRIEGHFGIGLPEPAIHTPAGSTPQTAAGSTAPTATGLTQT